MASLAELANEHTDLSEPQISHLQHLVSNWGLISDLSFADMFLFGRVKGTREAVVLDQVRPTTGPTLYRQSRIGEVVSGRDLLDEAFDSESVVDGGLLFRPEAPRIRVLEIPVRHDGKVIAVLSRQFSPDRQRLPRDLEVAYFTACRRIDKMVAEGVFPFKEGADFAKMPRVGDGTMLLNEQLQIEYLSPNARSTLVALGFGRGFRKRTLADLGLNTPAMTAGMAQLVPSADEIETGPDRIATLYSMPLVEDGEPIGALVLLKDISDLRRRDRLIDSKDATIAEIHHRVKNNLQTISSLLRLQGRRLSEPAAVSAIDESVRRIQSIAVVHELLSHDPGETSSFGEIARTLVRLVESGLVDRIYPVEFSISGDTGYLRSDQTTQLAIVLTEVLQNAVEHAFAAQGIGQGSVKIDLANDGNEVTVTVTDDGVGAHGAASSSSGLGRVIISTLVESELSGSVTYSLAGGPPDRPGTKVEIRFPV